MNPTSIFISMKSFLMHTFPSISILLIIYALKTNKNETEYLNISWSLHVSVEFHIDHVPCTSLT